MEGFSYTNFSSRVRCNELAYAFSFAGYVFVSVFCQLVCRLILLSLKGGGQKNCIQLAVVHDTTKCAKLFTEVKNGKLHN
jgi:hypothetical protein